MLILESLSSQINFRDFTEKYIWTKIKTIKDGVQYA